ncbi:hypothetical protein HGM15179_000361 [Zosterops borbonicus]|uniref:Uncharacterized protein n=1 Tax=Zosterops borbonicus TaxID=364589 RepID=A0A8K1LTY4_9PASS|nr:hypothetical protein HGM15179_000361 [Zosterops borbonicus]
MAQHRVLHLGHNNPCSAAGLGRVVGKLPRGKGPGGAGPQGMNMSQECPGGQEGQWHLAWINSVASRTRAGIAPLCWALVRPHPKSWIEFGAPHDKKYIEVLQHVQEAVKLGKSTSLCLQKAGQGDVSDSQ